MFTDIVCQTFFCSTEICWNLFINVVVVVNSPHQSPRCGVSQCRSAQSIMIPLFINCQQWKRRIEEESMKLSFCGVDALC